MMDTNNSTDNNNETTLDDSDNKRDEMSQHSNSMIENSTSEAGEEDKFVGESDSTIVTFKKTVYQKALEFQQEGQGKYVLFSEIKGLSTNSTINSVKHNTQFYFACEIYDIMENLIFSIKTRDIIGPNKIALYFSVQKSETSRQLSIICIDKEWFELNRSTIAENDNFGDNYSFFKNAVEDNQSSLITIIPIGNNFFDHNSEGLNNPCYDFIYKREMTEIIRNEVNLVAMLKLVRASFELDIILLHVGITPPLPESQDLAIPIAKLISKGNSSSTTETYLETGNNNQQLELFDNNNNNSLESPSLQPTSLSLKDLNSVSLKNTVQQISDEVNFNNDSKPAHLMIKRSASVNDIIKDIDEILDDSSTISDGRMENTNLTGDQELMDFDSFVANDKTNSTIENKETNELQKNVIQNTKKPIRNNKKQCDYKKKKVPSKSKGKPVANNELKGILSSTFTLGGKSKEEISNVPNNYIFDEITKTTVKRSNRSLNQVNNVNNGGTLSSKNENNKRNLNQKLKPTTELSNVNCNEQDDQVKPKRAYKKKEKSKKESDSFESNVPENKESANNSKSQFPTNSSQDEAALIAKVQKLEAEKDQLASLLNQAYDQIQINKNIVSKLETKVDDYFKRREDESTGGHKSAINSAKASESMFTPPLSKNNNFNKNNSFHNDNNYSNNEYITNDLSVSAKWNGKQQQQQRQQQSVNSLQEQNLMSANWNCQQQPQQQSVNSLQGLNLMSANWNGQQQQQQQQQQQSVNSLLGQNLMSVNWNGQQQQQQQSVNSLLGQNLQETNNQMQSFMQNQHPFLYSPQQNNLSNTNTSVLYGYPNQLSPMQYYYPSQSTNHQYQNLSLPPITQCPAYHNLTPNNNNNNNLNSNQTTLTQTSKDFSSLVLGLGYINR